MHVVPSVLHAEHPGTVQLRHVPVCKYVYPGHWARQTLFSYLLNDAEQLAQVVAPQVAQFGVHA